MKPLGLCAVAATFVLIVTTHSFAQAPMSTPPPAMPETGGMKGEMKGEMKKADGMTEKKADTMTEKKTDGMEKKSEGMMEKKRP